MIIELKLILLRNHIDPERTTTEKPSSLLLFRLQRHRREVDDS